MNAIVFSVGVLVTVIVGAALSLLIWAAVMDGREQDQALGEPESAGGEVVPLQPAGGGGRSLRHVDAPAADLGAA